MFFSLLLFFFHGAFPEVPKNGRLATFPLMVKWGE
jgi:hypothetical protein